MSAFSDDVSVGYNNMILTFQKNVTSKTSQLKNCVWIEA